MLELLDGGEHPAVKPCKDVHGSSDEDVAGD
jgi:hypothetical protein